MAKAKKNTKKNKTSKILKDLWEYDDELVALTGYDDCILGIVSRIDFSPIICYDTEKVIKRLMRDKMTYEEAVEFFEFNIIGAYFGSRTPCFMGKLDQLY
jgi:hypothetical protein